MKIDRALMGQCEFILPGFRAPDVSTVLREIADSPYAELAADTYGDGAATKLLNERLTTLFDKPAARFCIKGMIAQMSALRAAIETKSQNTVALHRLTHFDYDESGAVEILHPIRFLRTGDHNQPFTVADLDGLGELPAVVSVELPLRRAGYKLTAYKDLVDISTWCKQHDVHFHIDGARIFGAAIAYEKTLKDVAALCDSMYFSFYKELGNIGGSGLIASAEFLDACDIWITRHGGNIVYQFPYVISALMGLDKSLEQIPNYVQQAKLIAVVFNQIEGVSTLPLVPQTSGFQVHLQLPFESAMKALETMVKQHKVWIIGGLYNTARPDTFGFDLEVGQSTLVLTPQQWSAHMVTLMQVAKSLD